MARTEARRILGDVAKGGDPSAERRKASKAATVAELCDAYFEAAKAGRILTRRKQAKKPSTLDGDRGRLERHIKPLIGHLKVGAVTSADIEGFRDAVSEGKTRARIKTGKHGLARVTGGRGTATRAMGLAGAIFAFAVRSGLRADNPARGVERHAYEKRQRCMTEAEYATLGEALRTVWPAGAAATRFLALSGWRRGEALALTWAEVDLAARTARLQKPAVPQGRYLMRLAMFCARSRAWQSSYSRHPSGLASQCAATLKRAPLRGRHSPQHKHRAEKA
jgi:integrase